ncbi:MAG: REP-associated tyrosine transposase [Candidatus Fervidibacter sp.]|uniref:REP-associated tyrosine transposase n=1 Tax=Candidatus Fervidibacter sp. TaxID=3100871 RepID=UPI00404B7318
MGEVAVAVMESLFRWQDLCRFPLLAFVIMLNHVHVLGILTTSEPLGKVFGRWKNWSAREANRVLQREGKFWQSAFYDHAVRNDEDLFSIAAYIEANPIRAGLVDDPTQFPYSSAFPSNAERLLGWRWLVGEMVFDQK